MIKILSTKKFTGNPADGIDNFNQVIFGRLLKDQIDFINGQPWDFPKEKFDILWGNGGLRDLLFLIFKPRTKRYIINWHTVLIRDENFWRVRTPWWARRVIFNQADLVIAVSEFSAQSVKKYFPHKKVVSILNGVDLELFNPVKRNEKYLLEKYGLNFSQPMVVFVGAFQPRKRPDLFMELAREYTGANFVMVGHRNSDGLAMSPILNLPNLHWIPAMPREDIATLLVSSQIFVFPSLNEASAAVILEAMASGCIPVVSKSGGNPEFLTDGESGFLIGSGPEEKKQFMEKLTLLLNDQNLRERISRASRAEAERHSSQRVAQLYLAAIG